MTKVRVKPVGELTIETVKPRLKLASKPPKELPSTIGLGSMAYSDRAMADKFIQPIGKKQVNARNTWADTALVLVERAKKGSQSFGKKDFNALYRLVLSAGIAYDKAFPQVQAPAAGNLIIQLFGGLGSSTTRAILEPPRPMLDIEDVVEVQADARVEDELPK